MSTMAETYRHLHRIADPARQLAEARACDSDALMVAELAEAQGKLEALVKATQPMDFCHVCLSVHSNFRDASDHKDWCAWNKADIFLRGTKEGK